MMSSFKLTENDIFVICVNLDKRNELDLTHILENIKRQQKIENISQDVHDIIRVTLRKYKNLKGKFHKKHGYDHIIKLGKNEVVLDDSHLSQSPDIKRKRLSVLEENSVHSMYRPSKSFNELTDKGQRQKQRSEEIVEILQNHREKSFPDMSLNQLLGYILFRENRQNNKEIADIGWTLYKDTLDVGQSFSIDDVIALKHNLTLSRDQIRKLRYMMMEKEITFPTTNELNKARKNLRPVVSIALEGKGVKVNYEELIRHTTESILKICIEEGSFERIEGDSYEMFYKDGCDGAGMQTKMKTNKSPENQKSDSEHHIFQYGITPLKLICTRASSKTEVMWENKSPNSQFTVRPVYLIRETETNEELQNEVITTTDRARDKLNSEGMVIDFAGSAVDMKFNIKDTMKDLKMKRNLSGLKGAKCILCHTKQADWTCTEKVHNGFPITHTVEETMQIYTELSDENGIVKRSPGDFEIRKGCTAKPLTTSDQHSICITHSYINGTTWFLKLLYRCYSDYTCWIEYSDTRGDSVRNAKTYVLNKIEANHGLILDQCALATAKTGTSTTGGQGRRFFSEEVLQTLLDIIPKKYEENLLLLHKQLSIILRIVSFNGQINVDIYDQLCQDFSMNLINNFPFALLNDTLHATVHHSPELIRDNEGYSLGALSEEGLEGNNKDIRNYLSRFCRKTSMINQVTDVMNRLLERSDPKISNKIKKQRSQKRCTECGSTEHTIRSHARKYSLPKGDFESAFNEIIL